MNIKSRFKRFWSSNLLYDSTTDTERTYTRKINPKLGLLGFCGLLGFLGFLPDLTDIPFPLFFFAFFGLFSFYYEGKMSNTLIDERFKVNAYRAEALANKISMMMIIFLTLVFVLKLEKPELVISFLIALIGLAFGLSVFLQQYLLYRFEHEE